jgi:hypothetical protein
MILWAGAINPVCHDVYPKIKDLSACLRKGDKPMRSFILICLLLSFSPAWAKKTLPCKITVEYFNKIGTKTIKTYEISARSKQVCTKRANLYRTNSTPQEVDQKKVSVKWLGK